LRGELLRSRATDDDKTATMLFALMTGNKGAAYQHDEIAEVYVAKYFRLWVVTFYS
jgi:hypothetical protein